MDAIENLRKKLIRLLSQHCPPLKITFDSEENFEVIGNTPAMQGRKKVDGIYFASIKPKPKDVRLYFFPIYTHPESFSDISPSLKKTLKGKSCFHFRTIDSELENEIKKLFQKGIDLYKKDGLII